MIASLSFTAFAVRKLFICLGKLTRVLSLLYFLLLLWDVLVVGFLLSHLFYVFLETSFYTTIGMKQTRIQLKKIVAPNCWLELEASFMQVITDWTKEFHLAMALSTYKFDTYMIGLFQTSFWNSVTFFHKTHRVNLIRYL